MGDAKYSVLMSVYLKESPEFLRQSMESIYNQTIPTDNFVLVCDGPLNAGLYKVIEEQKGKFQEALKIIQLEKNCGLGNALNEGMKHCCHELVARMDSDDISFPKRCERQLQVFKDRPEVAICSGTVLEFKNTLDQITGRRILPEKYEEICKFSHKRNPFNHPAVMFRKLAVEKSGGYQERYHLFEDYDLWVRMYLQGCIFANLSQTILYMRVNDMHMRRGGISYARVIIAFQVKMHRRGVITLPQCLYSMAVRVAVSLLPNRIRKRLYGRKLRSPGRELKGKR